MAYIDEALHCRRLVTLRFNRPWSEVVTALGQDIVKQVQEMVGRRFGILTVQSRNNEIRVGRRAYWNCVCDCGGTRVVSTRNLTGSVSKSCGCAAWEHLKPRKPGSGGPLKHGESRGKHRSIELRAYDAAKERCSNKNNPKYPRYGGRGIEFHFTSFGQFFSRSWAPTVTSTFNRSD
jgi:hypothetical protein